MNTMRRNENILNLHHAIASDVWPDGWDMVCKECGKVVHLTVAECGYCLAHGWPECCGKSMHGQTPTAKGENLDG